jgi:hypothetical protein
MRRLEERRRARRWLNREDSTDLWFEELLLYESDLFNGSEVDRGSLDGIGCNAKP